LFRKKKGGPSSLTKGGGKGIQYVFQNRGKKGGEAPGGVGQVASERK